MPKVIPVSRKHQADDHLMLNVIVILAMLLLSAYLAETFPGGEFDSEAPTSAMQGWTPKNR